MICAVPLVLLGAFPAARCWGYLGTSVVLHIVSTVLLMMAYRAIAAGFVTAGIAVLYLT